MRFTYTMESPLRVALIGYGLAGRVFHAPLIQANPDLALEAVITSDPERQQQVREDLPTARVPSTAEEVWAAPEDFDLVVIATANIAHLPHTLAAIAAGFHTVVDKPLAGDAEQGRRIEAAANAAGRQVHPFQNRRWDSDFLTLLSLSDQIGRIHRFESHFDRFRSVPKGGWRDLADPAQLGGVLLDFGAHLVDQAIELLGPVAQVSATARTVRDASASDDDMQIHLTHTNGAISYLTGSQVSVFAEPRFNVLGTSGGILMTAGDSQEAALKAGLSPVDDHWGVEPMESSALLRACQPDGSLRDSPIPLTRGRWDLFYVGVVNSLRDLASPPVPLADAVANLRVLDAARESVASCATVRLEQPAGHN